MFGGRKFNKNSEILRDADAGKSNAGGSITSVNDTLFQKVNDAENHAKQIMKTGQSQYVDGIKQNVLDMIRLWLQEDGSNIFTLYGKMGCGKSFFSARLYEDISAEKDRYDTVAFSSQQIYRDTANVRNMLLSLAHQLFIGVPACSDYFARHQLESESIANLTEDVLVNPFEGVTLQKTVFIIIDGLDEYPRPDCEVFLESLGRLRMRLNPRVKIFFSSRPEAYIMSEMFYDSENCSYHIEKNEVQSHADCARFIDVKCGKADIQIDDNMKRQLIIKSECSLKYLECFFNDISCGAIHVTADFIDSLPMGLSHYYRDQLVRYFGDEGLRFYQTKIVPLLELLCVAWRPITIEEASDILGCRESDINSVISRSGTLLWRNNRYVMLYQSESIREFLMDERYCPEKYRIDSGNGNACILRRLEEMMDNGEDIENNMYLFNCAIDHITEQDRITNADWALLVRMIACYSHKADLMFKLPRRILEKTIREIMTFSRCLFANTEMDPLLQDAFCVRLIAAAVSENQTEKLLSVLDALEGPEKLEFFVNYGRGRILRTEGRRDEALALLQPCLDQVGDDALTLARHTYYQDEVCRIYRRQGRITWEENTDLHIQTIRESEQLTQKYQRREGPAYLILLRNLSVSYDQLARLCDLLEDQTDPQLRESCGRKLQATLKLAEADPNKKGFFLLAADACFQKGLKLSKICQQYDAFSDSRIYDLHYSFYALGILYFRKDFPGYHPDKALQYFEDGLSSIMDIAMRPESHERYIRVPIKIYSKLTDLYLENGSYAAAKKYLAEESRMKDLRVLYHPSADSEFARCYCYEEEADIVKAEHGIEAAESYYLTAARHYEACGKKYSDLFVQRARHIVYSRIASAYKQASNLPKFVEYSRLELAEIERVYSLYPSASLRWDWGVTQEHLANALRKIDSAGTRAQRIELQESAVAIYQELAAAHPEVEKYHSAPCIVYYHLCLDCRDSGLLDDALNYMDKVLSMCRNIAPHHPNYSYLLDLPIRLFLCIHKHLTDQTVYQKYFDECKDYLTFADPYCDDHDFEDMKCLFLDHEAMRIRDTQGIEAAEPYFLAYIEIAKAHATKWPSEESLTRVAWGYTDLFQGYQQRKQNTKAVCYLQDALEILDRSIEHLPTSVKLRKLRCALYGALADILKDDSDVKFISTAADLYIMQLQQYMILHKETEAASDKEDFSRLINKTYSMLTSFLRMQEAVVKAARSCSSCSKELLREYVKIIVTVYTFFADGRIEGAQEKLDHYTDLLSQLSDE